MALTYEQVVRIQLEVMSGQPWENRTAAVPDTEEAHAVWDSITADIAQAAAKGHQIDVGRE